MQKFGFYQNFYLPLHGDPMRIIGKKILLKVKKKNLGNLKLCSEIDTLISDLEDFKPGEKSIHEIRSDADNVHGDGFYFFHPSDINIG